MSEKLAHARKDLLNKPGFHSTAAISSVIKISFEEDGVGKKNGFVDINFQMSDCHRSINLDFPIGDEARFDNSMFKIQTLIDHMVEFRDGMIKSREILKENLDDHTQ